MPPVVINIGRQMHSMYKEMHGSLFDSRGRTIGYPPCPPHRIDRPTSNPLASTCETYQAQLQFKTRTFTQTKEQLDASIGGLCSQSRCGKMRLTGFSLWTDARPIEPPDPANLEAHEPTRHQLYLMLQALRFSRPHDPSNLPETKLSLTTQHASQETKTSKGYKGC